MIHVRFKKNQTPEAERPKRNGLAEKEQCSMVHFLGGSGGLIQFNKTILISSGSYLSTKAMRLAYKKIFGLLLPQYNIWLFACTFSSASGLRNSCHSEHGMDCELVL